MDEDDRDAPVVVGVDAAQPSRAAAEWAARLAAARGVPLHLLHAADAAGPPPAWLSDLAASARRAGVAVVVADVVPGRAGQVLTDRSAGAAMLVLGSYGEGSPSGTLAGAVALEVLDGAECPVAVVRGAAPTVPPPDSGPVVAGVDGSASSRAALLLAADLAVALGTDVVAVHARPTTEAGAPGAELLDQELAVVTAAHPDLPVRGELVDDTPLRPLLRHAEGARALVVGQRGDVVTSTILQLGSTSRALVEFAPCPVVVAPPGSAPQRG